MKTFAGAFVALIVLLAIAAPMHGQNRGLPPNVPPNPNYVITPWGEPPTGTTWLDQKAISSMTYDPHGKGTIVVLVRPPKASDPAVWVFDLDGHLQRTWGANMFVRPYDMIVDGNNLWIIDLEQNFVWRAADLIGVPARERIALRRRIAARAARGETAFAPSTPAAI